VRGIRAAQHHHIASLGELANGHEHWTPRGSEVLWPVGHDELQRQSTQSATVHQIQNFNSTSKIRLKA